MQAYRVGRKGPLLWVKQTLAAPKQLPSCFAHHGLAPSPAQIAEDLVAESDREHVETADLRAVLLSLSHSWSERHVVVVAL